MQGGGGWGGAEQTDREGETAAADMGGGKVG